MSVAVKLATNYEKISRRGTATILLSKHISCNAIDKLLNDMEFLSKELHEYKKVNKMTNKKLSYAMLCVMSLLLLIVPKGKCFCTSYVGIVDDNFPET
jgi:hypothetical protein